MAANPADDGAITPPPPMLMEGVAMPCAPGIIMVGPPAGIDGGALLLPQFRSLVRTTDVPVYCGLVEQFPVPFCPSKRLFVYRS